VSAASEKPGVACQRLRSVDALRGLAALMVLLKHVPHPEGLANSSQRFLFLPFDYGPQGVILFLVISGFCIHLNFAKKLAAGQGAACNWASFWQRRFYRLYPPYLAAICFSVLCVFVVQWINPGSPVSWVSGRDFGRDLGTHLLLIHNLFPRYVTGLGNGAFWSLGLEEQLYLLYALFLIVRIRLGLYQAFVGTLALSIIWYLTGVVGFFEHTCPGWANWPFTWWAVWMLGVLAAENFTGAARLPAWCFSTRNALASLGAGVLLYFPVSTLLHTDRLFTYLLGPVPLARHFLSLNCFSHYAFALAFFISINWVVGAEASGRWNGMIKAWFAKVGIFSYSLYLVHIPTIVVTEAVFGQLVIGYAAGMILIRYAVMVPLCLVTAWAFFQLVESRFLNSGRAKQAARPAEETIKMAA
jgi:peptidoglycan/LPS O-acetylase OafA/YrhL